MKKSLVKNVPAFILLLVSLILTGYKASSQTEDTSRITIHMDNMDRMTVIKTDSGEFTWFNGSVILRQGTDTLYCDSALQNNTTRNFEAFSNVRIAQAGGTHGTSDYLKYTSDKKLAFMNGNVHMTDGKNNLDCATLTYNLGLKLAIYDNGGRLYNDSTTVTSNKGEYSIQQKEARFRGNAKVIDTQYRIKSEDMMYNTETKVTVFYAKSVVTRDSGRSILETSDGWYDGKLGIAHFKGFSKIWNDGQYIEGDSLYYNKQTGYGIAVGHVRSIDTAKHSTMYCGRAEYFQKQRKLWATIKPVLEQVNGKDTIYIRADTFYSAPMVRSKPSVVANKKAGADSLKLADGKDIKLKPVKDSVVHGLPAGKGFAKDSLGLKRNDTGMVILVQPDTAMADIAGPVMSSKFHVPVSKDDTGGEVVQKKLLKSTPAKTVKKKNKKGTIEKLGVITTIPDSAAADTTAPLYFIGYHHVLIFSDSLQGKCDSVCYTRADSLIRMIYSPIAWSHNSQITGDTILMQLDSTTLRKMYVPNNALIVSQSGPEKAKIWDQIQGRTLTAYFDSNAIKQMVVKPDAECIYYSKNDAGAYLGVCQASSIRMFIYFNDQKIKTIKLDRDAHQTLTPMDKADLPNTKLSKFKWLIEQRPKSKEELFR